MNRGFYRKLPKKKCIGCDYPCYQTSKNVNPKRACIKCRKDSTKRNKKGGGADE